MHTSEKVTTIFEAPERVRDQYAEVDGYRTHYLEAGDPAAPPLLLVHGGSVKIGMGVDRWYPTVIPLSETFHVYAIDQLGHGDTDAPRNPRDLGMVTARAEHVIKFIEHLQLGPVHLVGQSQGGWIITYITLKRPDLVANLVIIDSASLSGSAVGGKLPFFKDAFRPGTMIPKADLTSRQGILDHVSKFTHTPDVVTDDLLDRLVALSAKWFQRYRDHDLEFWQESGWDRHAEMYSIDGTYISELVHELTIPPLLLCAKQSNKGIDASVELYKKIPGAQMHIIDKANHFLWLDQPGEVNSLITWYLSEH